MNDQGISVSKAAHLFGVDRRTIDRKIREHNIEPMSETVSTDGRRKFVTYPPGAIGRVLFPERYRTARTLMEHLYPALLSGSFIRIVRGCLKTEHGLCPEAVDDATGVVALALFIGIDEFLGFPHGTKSGLELQIPDWLTATLQRPEMKAWREARGFHDDH